MVSHSVDSPQWANIATKWAVQEEGDNDCDEENQVLPSKEPPCHTAQGGVACQEEKTRKGPRGADPLTEPGGALPNKVDCKDREEDYQDYKDKVSKEGEDFLSGETFQFFGERDLIEEILEPPEGAEPTTHKASQGGPHPNNEAPYIEGGVSPP